MNLSEHLLTCLAEECGEVMEILYLDPSNEDELEYELNDIVSVAHLLNDNKIISVDLRPTNTQTSESEKTGVQYRNIFSLVSKIHYFTCKSLRFGLNGIKPNSIRLNKAELDLFLESLVTVLGNNNSDIKLWDRSELKVKEEKVVAHYKLAIENNTLKV